MPNKTYRRLADIATAQVREVYPLLEGDVEAARKLSAELRRIAADLDRRHSFPGRTKRIILDKQM